MIYLPPIGQIGCKERALGWAWGVLGLLSPESTSAGTEPLRGSCESPPGPTSNPTGDTRLWVFFFVFFILVLEEQRPKFTSCCDVAMAKPGQHLEPARSLRGPSGRYLYQYLYTAPVGSSWLGRSRVPGSPPPPPAHPGCTIWGWGTAGLGSGRQG